MSVGYNNRGSVDCKYEVYDYETAWQSLNYRDSKVIAHNTALHARWDRACRPYIGLILHNTEILRYYPKKSAPQSLILWSTGGWNTRTTISRLIQFTPDHYRFWRRNWIVKSTVDIYHLDKFTEYERHELPSPIPSHLLGYYNQPEGEEIIKLELGRIEEKIKSELGITSVEAMRQSNWN